VPSGLGERTLGLISALVGTLTHGHPAEHRFQHAALLRAVRTRPGRVQELKLVDGTRRDNSGGQLVGPRLPMLVLQDAEQPGGVDEVERRAWARLPARPVLPARSLRREQLAKFARLAHVPRGYSAVR
jgi:hypothetical protein